MTPLDKAHALQIARQSLAQEIETLRALQASLGETFWQCAKLLCECRGVAWVTGVGTSAAVGSRFAHVLTCSGLRSMFLSTIDGLHGHSLVIQPEDLLIALSRGGGSQEVNQMVSIANQRGATTIALVHRTDSPLARLCRYVLPVQSPQEYELGGYLATASTIAFSAMCDALCAVVLAVKGFDLEAFQLTHPGGAVGETLSTRENSPIGGNDP